MEVSYAASTTHPQVSWLNCSCSKAGSCLCVHKRLFLSFCDGNTSTSWHNVFLCGLREGECDFSEKACRNCGICSLWNCNTWAAHPPSRHSYFTTVGAGKSEKSLELGTLAECMGMYLFVWNLRCWWGSPQWWGSSCCWQSKIATGCLVPDALPDIMRLHTFHCD